MKLCVLGYLLTVIHALQTHSFSPAFVVTGGPCSGKTEAINSLPSVLGGWQLLNVPEAATLYFDRGGKFPFGQPADISGRYSPTDRNLLWEAWLIELKISLENHAHSAAALALENTGLPSALICDRGIFDSRAYLGKDDEWEQLLQLAGWQEDELLGRYAGVVSLEVAPEDAYNLGNEARHESFSEALSTHHRTVDAWTSAAARAEARIAAQGGGIVDAVPSGILRGGFEAEFALDRIGHERRLQIPTPPVLARVENPTCGGGFPAKVRAVRSCLEGFLLGESRDRPAYEVSFNDDAMASLTMPVEFIVEQANAIATAPDLGASAHGASPSSTTSQTGVTDMYESSVALLKHLQEVRRGRQQRSSPRSTQPLRNAPAVIARGL